MSGTPNAMEGISTPAPEDPAVQRKRKWIETVAEEMHVGAVSAADTKSRRLNPARNVTSEDPRYATSTARRREVLADHYDDVLRHEGFATTTTTTAPGSTGGGMDVDVTTTAQPATPPVVQPIVPTATPSPIAAQLAAFERKRALLRSMRHAPYSDTALSDEERRWDQEDAQRVAASGLALPDGTPGRRAQRKRIAKTVPPEEQIGDLPADQPTLLYADRPKSLNYRDEGDKPRERSATAFTFLAKSYLPKGRGKKPPGAEKINKMPDPVYMQQTELSRGLFAGSSADDVATTDYGLLKFPDPAGENPKSDRNLGWFSANATPQGPHSVAFIALATAMRKRKQAKDSQPTLAGKIAVVRGQIDEMLAVGHIAPPQEVYQILLEEEAALFKPGSSSAAPVFADGADEQRKERVARYANSYTEYYNQLTAMVSHLSSGDPADWGADARAINAALEAAYDRAEQLLNMHPYQSYGWRAGDPVVVGQEMGGKGEAAAKDRLFGDTPEGEDDPLKHRMSGLAKVVDGWDPDRLARDPQRYRGFLIQRISFLLGDYAKQMSGKPLEACELDELYNMMLDQNLAHLAEKEAEAQAAQSTGQ